MKVKTFRLVIAHSEVGSIEERVNDWLDKERVETIEVTTSSGLLIIFYKSFVPNVKTP